MGIGIGGQFGHGCFPREQLPLLGIGVKNFDVAYISSKNKYLYLVDSSRIYATLTTDSYPSNAEIVEGFSDSP